jgi:tetratricopeptide (TPR) repeat protein
LGLVSQTEICGGPTAIEFESHRQSIRSQITITRTAKTGQEQLIMTRRSFFLALLAVLTVVHASSLLAIDTVTRKSDGKRFGGTIIEMSKNDFKVKKQTGEPDVIQANDVAAVDWDGAPAEMRLGISDENGGKYESAVQRYTKSRSDAKNPSEALKVEFDYLIARATGRMALADPTKLPAAITALQAVQKSSPEHFRYYETVSLLGQLQIASGNFDGARSTFELLSKAPWGDYKIAAKIASGRILTAENKLDEAAKEFEAAAASATDSPADQIRKYEAMLGQARALVMQTKFEEALKILDVVTDKGPADESALQAEAYVLQGDSLQALGRAKEAALAYLHVDILFSRESSFHAAALFNLTTVWKLVQLPDRSAEAEAKLVQNYPNSDWRKKLTGTPAAP